LSRSNAELPGFVAPLQQARDEARRQAFQRVQQLTRAGRHDEAQALWEQEISCADDSHVA
jgi:hypothetical protein